MPSLNNQDLTAKFATPYRQYPARAVIVCATVFALTLFVYVGLEFFYKDFLTRTGLAPFEDRLIKLDKAITVEEQAELMLFHSQIMNLQSLLATHPRPTALLRLLEENTLPDVYYTSVSYKKGTKESDKLLLTGVAPTYHVVAQQAAVFAKVQDIDMIQLNSATRREELIGFDMTIVLGAKALQF